jgi:F0F1-type ATP synthase beta subunit
VYAIAEEDGRLLPARLSDTSPVGSTDAAWVPPDDLKDGTALSPAAADALRMLDRAKAALTP